ncbi:hypothetical protein TREMEDRAFT_63274 [Tremella mesenterica DSM 1558]|uniref:uncharacterized protein n=1 Tax=Tremella mesenterica (strain ATCC 24925 / CBS 8224 / DSM 1558 / NBRC 9311 / NRRL Y-6157 / RJB 2259-6 / UBC 559-6) TaxID=578456 RepID=UPI0003F4A610|nr:uncharacterized protein TREMEDRAFT_63274 [Tremella mesenterica DSM 1558]EIW68812.1 hypothetical protein TREMEDRAFT_63274 [Tremella mesenterica DSM 1558]
MSRSRYTERVASPLGSNPKTTPASPAPTPAPRGRIRPPVSTPSPLSSSVKTPLTNSSANSVPIKPSVNLSNPAKYAPPTPSTPQVQPLKTPPPRTSSNVRSIPIKNDPFIPAPTPPMVYNSTPFSQPEVNFNNSNAEADPSNIPPPIKTEDNLHRESTASFSGIGGILTQSYDSDSDSEMETLTTTSPKPREARVKSMRAEAERVGNIRSVEGELGLTSIPNTPQKTSFSRPTPTSTQVTSASRQKQSDGMTEQRPKSILKGGLGQRNQAMSERTTQRPPTIVHFPEPAMTGRIRDGPIGLGSNGVGLERPRPTLVIPQTPNAQTQQRLDEGQSPFSPHDRTVDHNTTHSGGYPSPISPQPDNQILQPPAQLHQNQYYPPHSPQLHGSHGFVNLPPPASPISPFLAAPRPQMKEGGRRVGQGIRRTDFWVGRKGEEVWKRMSVMMKLEGGGDSEWLAKQQSRRTTLRRLIWGGLITTILIVIVIVVILVLRSKL